MYYNFFSYLLKIITYNLLSAYSFYSITYHEVLLPIEPIKHQYEDVYALVRNK